ncbi:MAG TPA: hypothetical protein V6D28_20710 [Leptolyngbyaceae cyanobacterium]
MIPDLLDEPNFFLLLMPHFIMAAMALIVSQRKGFNFGVWLALSLIGGGFTLIAALLIKRKD